MSGIYISGVDLPKSSVELRLIVRQTGLVFVESFGIFEERQATPIPDHGRLVDADEAVKLLKSIGNREYRRENGTICDAIKMLSFDAYTPTVIPAERGAGE